MGFVELNADNIIYIDPGLAKPIIGIEEYRSAMEKIIGKVHYQGSEYIEPRVVEVGDAALLTYNYLSTEFSPNGTINWQTPWNVTVVFSKQSGSWKTVHAHFSYVNQQMRDRVEVPLMVSPTPVEYEGLLGELLKLERGAMERWRKGDPSGYMELYAQGVTYFDTGTPQRLNGWEAMQALYKTLEGKISYEVMDFIDPRLIDLDQLAVLFYRFFSTRLNHDGSVASRTPWNCTEIYQHFPGGWKIIHNHWSFIMGERG
jgi:ketosteroid isomerase-like protein